MTVSAKNSMENRAIICYPNWWTPKSSAWIGCDFSCVNRRNLYNIMATLLGDLLCSQWTLKSSIQNTFCSIRREQYTLKSGIIGINGFEPGEISQMRWHWDANYHLRSLFILFFIDDLSNFSIDDSLSSLVVIQTHRLVSSFAALSRHYLYHVIMSFYPRFDLVSSEWRIESKSTWWERVVLKDVFRVWPGVTRVVIQ